VLPNKYRAEVATVAKNACITKKGMLIKFNEPLDEEELYGDYFAEHIIIPKSLVSVVFKYAHTDYLAGHKGIAETYRRVSKKFYWLTMKEDITEYVKTCDICQKHNPLLRKTAGLMRSADIRKPFEKIAVDLMGPYPITSKRNTHLFVIVDTCSGWVECFPLPTFHSPLAKTKTMCERALKVFCTFGFPRVMISDNGPEFANEIWTGVLTILGIKYSFASPYHPESNPTERRNRDIKYYIKKYLDKNHKNWDLRLNEMLFSMRTTKVTSTGFTPARLIFGHELNAPEDLVLIKPDYSLTEPLDYKSYAEQMRTRIQNAIKIAMDNKSLSSENQKIYFDRNHRRDEFQIGDFVLLKSHQLSNYAKGVNASLSEKWEGPFIVIGKQGELTYILGDTVNQKPVTYSHVANLKRYNVSQSQPKVVLDDLDLRQEKISEFRSKLGIGKRKGRKKLEPTSSTFKPP
jgi:hypothetical protein